MLYGIWGASELSAGMEIHKFIRNECISTLDQQEHHITIHYNMWIITLF